MAFQLNPHTGELVKTYLPRTNFLNTFKKSGAHSIDILSLFPALSGSVCFRPDFTDATDTEDLEIGSAVYDLRRDDCALPNRVDLMNVSPTGAVTISGTPEEDQTFFAVTNTIADPNGLGTFSYQWSADGSAVSGATGNSYLLTQADVGKAFTVTVSYTDGGGTLESLTSAATSAVVNVNDPPVGTVTITGTTTQGETLTASASITDEDGIGAFSYQWKADGVAISGATSTTYVLTAAEAGKQITCTVSYTDGQGTAESLTSAATAAVVGTNSPPTGNVVITGLVVYGKTLTADTSDIADANGLGTFSYQWSADSTAISGATNSTYTLTQTEVGKAMTVTVSYTDGLGTAESLTSAATADVAAQIEYTISNSGTTFTLRSYPYGTADYTVDWGDGNSETSTSNALAHTYASSGTYVIKVNSNSGVYYPFFYASADVAQITSIAIGTDDPTVLGTSLSPAFYGASNLTTYTQVYSATSNVQYFREAWRGCTNLSTFPLIDISSATDVLWTWRDCSSLTSFPLLDFSNVTSISQSWQGCSGLTSFPLIDTSSATIVGAWPGCSSLTSFPALDFSSITYVGYGWYACSSLATFPANMFDTTGTLNSNAFTNAWTHCALTAQSIENILTSLDTNGASNITLGINGGTNAGKTTWSTAANTAYNNLITKGWTISYNS